MIHSLYPCLWFNGQGRAAYDLYASVFPGSSLEQESELVLHFTLLGKKIMALNGGPQFSINPSISFFVNCAGEPETRRVWEALSGGAEELMPLCSYPWSTCYGWLKDRFGMTWQIMVADENTPAPCLRPCLFFSGRYFGRAAAAMEHYVAVFPDSAKGFLAVFPEGDPHAGKLMYGECRLNGYELIFMDGPGAHGFEFSEGVSLVVACDTQAEIDHCWNRLLEGGGVEQSCGWLKDADGVSWQVIPSQLGEWMQDPVKGPAVMNALLQMKKFDLETLRALAG